MNADDWLITPPILKGGHTYLFAFNALPYDGSLRVERLEVKWGNAPTAEAMTEEILPVTELDYEGKQLFEKEIMPSVDGEYYIGFNSVSPANSYTISIDDISLSETTSSGIDELTQSRQSDFKVYSIDGKLAANDRQSSAKLKPGVYVVDGKKILIK